MGVCVFDDVELLYAAARDRFVAACQRAIEARGRFRVALAGGSTPRGLYELLARETFGRQAKDAWSRIDLFWGDERHVPPDNVESNYRMVSEALLTKILPPADNVHRMRGEVADAARVAAEYEADLRRVFGIEPGEVPRFDLVLLGMGPDGHTASLFPGTSALDVSDHLVVSNWVKKLRCDRLTMTVPVLNGAREVMFLVRGADKAEALAAVLEGPYRPHEYPAQYVQPEAGVLRWLVDEAASARLQGVYPSDG